MIRGQCSIKRAVFDYPTLTTQMIFDEYGDSVNGTAFPQCLEGNQLM